ncbi:MAG: low molecular weight protein-tyrosine-phosphatase [Puniceicoccaceae bacterium]
MHSLLFVCLGNICRSPAAEAVLRHVLVQSGYSSLPKIDSAGTSSFHEGDLADHRMRAAAAARRIEITSRSRPVVDADFYNFDFLIAMDKSNYEALCSLSPEPSGIARIIPFARFLPEDYADREQGVPDPYYGGSKGFETVLDLLEFGCRRLALELLNESNTSLKL